MDQTNYTSAAVEMIHTLTKGINQVGRILGEDTGQAPRIIMG